MEKRKVCAVPFEREDIPVIINLSYFDSQYVIDSVVSPTGLGLDGKDIGVIENRGVFGYCVSSNLNESIRSCDTVLILEKEGSGPLFDYAIKAIDEAIRQKRDILCLLKLDKKIRNHYEEICKKSGICFCYFLYDSLPHISFDNISEPLYYPHSPIVFIGELTEGVQSYEVFCSIVKMYSDKGIKVSAISAERSNALFGLHAIDFSDVQGELPSRVYRINKYIKNIEDKEHPSIIIIRLPKPMIKFDEDVRYDFGLSSYLISQAIPTSYFIVCSPYGFFSNEFWYNLNNNFKAKFGFSIDAIHISNKLIDRTDLSDKNTLSYVHVPHLQAQEVVNQMTTETKFILGELTASYHMERVVNDIDNSLLHMKYELIT